MTVNVKETYLARPAKPTQNSPVILSNYDLIMLPIYASYIYFYKNVNHDDKFMDFHKLFSSLEDILSDYYPLAGRLKEEPEGRMSIARSDKGVPFVVAESPDITIKQLEERNWENSATPDGLLPFDNTMAESIDAPLLAVKHTTLADGSVVLGIAVNHLATDGNGFFSFLDNWGRKARKEPFTPPVHERSLLKASGNPPTQKHTEFVVMKPISNTTTMTSDLLTVSSITRKIFYFSKNNLKKIHDAYSGKDPDDPRISINDALVAHVWRTVTRARRIPLNEQVVCVFPFDIRKKLNPPLPSSYFGNAVINIYPKMPVSVLINGPRSKIALHIRKTLAEINESRIRSSIDWIEQQPKKYNVRPSGFSSNDLIFTSLGRFPVSNFDLGYGTPVKVRTRRNISFGGTVVILKTPAKDDGLEVCISLLNEHIQRLEQDPEFRMFQSLSKL